MTNTAEIEKKAESIEGVVFADPEQQYYVYPAEIRGAKLRAVKVGGSERGMSDKRMAEEIAKKRFRFTVIGAGSTTMAIAIFAKETYMSDWAELYSAENERLASQKKELRITIKRDAEVIDLGAKDPADLPEDCGCCVFNNERPVGNYTHTYCVLTGKETNELKLHENCPLEQKEVEV